jgi:hypothetical protein
MGLIRIVNNKGEKYTEDNRNTGKGILRPVQALITLML